MVAVLCGCLVWVWCVQVRDEMQVHHWDRMQQENFIQRCKECSSLEIAQVLMDEYEGALNWDVVAQRFEYERRQHWYPCPATSASKQSAGEIKDKGKAAFQESQAQQSQQSQQSLLLQSLGSSVQRALPLDTQASDSNLHRDASTPFQKGGPFWNAVLCEEAQERLGTTLEAHGLNLNVCLESDESSNSWIADKILRHLRATAASLTRSIPSPLLAPTPASPFTLTLAGSAAAHAPASVDDSRKRVCGESVNGGEVWGRRDRKRKSGEVGGPSIDLDHAAHQPHVSCSTHDPLDPLSRSRHHDESCRTRDGESRSNHTWHHPGSAEDKVGSMSRRSTCLAARAHALPAAGAPRSDLGEIDCDMIRETDGANGHGAQLVSSQSGMYAEEDDDNDEDEEMEEVDDADAAHYALDDDYLQGGQQALSSHDEGNLVVSCHLSHLFP